MLETKSSLEKPRMFKIRTFPIKETDLFFQLETHLSNLESRGSQLPRSTFTVPKTIPRILSFFTHERPSGWSDLSAQVPSHRASVLDLFNLALDPLSKSEIISKRACRDLSFFTNAVVSSAYCVTLNCNPPAPGRRKPSMSRDALILHAKTLTHKTYNMGDKVSPCRTPLSKIIGFDKKIVDQDLHKRSIV